MGLKSSEYEGELGGDFSGAYGVEVSNWRESWVEIYMGPEGWRWVISDFSGAFKWDWSLKILVGRHY